MIKSPISPYHPILPQISAKTLVKIFSKGTWVKKSIALRVPFLLTYSQKVLDNVIFLENCTIKLRGTVLIIIYATQFDERISIAFDSEKECQEYAKKISDSVGIRKFKDFYTKGEKIGQGKFSEVFYASEYLTGTVWAVKKIKKKTLDRIEREFIRKEVSIHSILNHKNIVKFKEKFNTRKYIYIVMERVKGGDLLKKISQLNRSETAIKKIIQQILEGVHYLHSLGVVHRDLKPENILIEDKIEDFSVKIIDFGLSTYKLPNEYLSEACGTLGYSAPEVFVGKYTEKIDLWSVGVVTFALFSGKLPFFSLNKAEMIEKIKQDELDFSEEKWESCSESGKDFVKKLLCKDPTRRPDCEQALMLSWLRGNCE